MATPLAARVPYCPANLREDEWYTRVGKSLFPLVYFADRDFPLEAEQIYVLPKQMGSVVVERDSSYVTKFGGSLRRSEEQAMMLVTKHTFVPVPRVFNSDIRDDDGHITISIIPGKSLNKLIDVPERGDKAEDMSENLGLLARLWNFLMLFEDKDNKPKDSSLSRIERVSSSRHSPSRAFIPG